MTDVASAKQVEQLTKYALSEFNRIDIIINNAGITSLSPMHKLKVFEWETMIDVNIKGVLYKIAAVLPHMRGKKEGHIINISSIAGFLVFPASAVYSGTNFAVRAITDGLRMEEAKNNIRTTIICSDWVDTELPVTISGSEPRSSILGNMKIINHASSVALAVAFAIEQPVDVAVNEMIIRPTV